jgi:hypothetical protein
MKYDLSTCTLSDFTVEMNISGQNWEDFIENHYKPKVMDKKKDIAPAMYLKEYLKSKIEKIVSLENQKEQIEQIRSSLTQRGSFFDKNKSEVKEKVKKN